MKFDFIIGNPPYQENYKGESNGANQIYNRFIDEARNVSKCGSLIHPARFLFNVGKTPKSWNKKMLHDRHFKILNYWSSSSDVFPNVEIKGGIVISYWDNERDFGEIGIFTPYVELNSIIQKVCNVNYHSLSEIVSAVGIYRITNNLYVENPWAKFRPSKGHEFDVTSNVFDVFPELFYQSNPNDDEYIQIFGRQKNKRCIKWIKKSYIKVPESFSKYRVFVTKANGTGEFGEILSALEIAEPYVGHTFSFLTIGGFDTRCEAESLRKYLSTKFARTMLDTLKATQDNLKETWNNVPLQDFTSSSDIDWSQSIADIDQQLYRKYDLDEKEIEFIETHVKEMK